MFKKELDIFFTAVMFYTRIPSPRWVNHSSDYLNKASRYFPFIGWIVGGISSVVLFCCLSFFSSDIAIILSMVATIFITGAFHEDGFADFCDGFGGGYTKERILEIMKDSRVGTYGVVGVLMILLLKFFVLRSILLLGDGKSVTLTFGLIMIVAHSLSRLSAISILFTNVYVQADAVSKIKSIAISFTWKEVVGSFLFGLFPVLVLGYLFPILLLLLIPVVVVRFILSSYFNRLIGGYTGDCLGATQQIVEIVIYLSLVVLWKYI